MTITQAAVILEEEETRTTAEVLTATETILRSKDCGKMVTKERLLKLCARLYDEIERKAEEERERYIKDYLERKEIR